MHRVAQHARLAPLHVTHAMVVAAAALQMVCVERSETPSVLCVRQVWPLWCLLQTTRHVNEQQRGEVGISFAMQTVSLSSPYQNLTSIVRQTSSFLWPRSLPNSPLD